jgi:UDPglucose--hexose-1-phosphate uridylyltransferase
VYVPFFAEYVYQLYVASKSHISNITQFCDREKDNLSLTFKMVTGMYDALFDKPFPYMMCMHNAPVNVGDTNPYFHFHIEFFTPLRSDGVQQFNASSETGVWAHCNPSAPEDKAGELREALERFKENI